ncbi:hypothetical protein [Geobacillus zalihae]|uniref:hypothetical protein n=1 Tax=Geobacillus TaxID=129337 RepID=UPI0033AEFC4C
MSLPRTSILQAQFDERLLGGMVKRAGQVLRCDDSDWDGGLYRNTPPTAKPFEFTAIPYYVWDNRQPGQMIVWIPEA